MSTYAKNKKAIYATNEKGEYQVIASTGWVVEGEATLQALHALQKQADVAYQAVVSGEKSALYYHMYAQRMDLCVLAQSIGTFQCVLNVILGLLYLINCLINGLLVMLMH